MGKVLPKSTFGKTPQEKSLENNTLGNVYLHHTANKDVIRMKSSEVNTRIIGKILGFTPLLRCLGECGLEAQIWILLRDLLTFF